MKSSGTKKAGGRPAGCSRATAHKTLPQLRSNISVKNVGAVSISVPVCASVSADSGSQHRMTLLGRLGLFANGSRDFVALRPRVHMIADESQQDSTDGTTQKSK